MIIFEDLILPIRYAFRQVHYEDLPTFLNDGEIRAKNHEVPQACHQASYQDIVNRRGSQQFEMPTGGVVNDFVPFYFSPITSYSYAIYKQKVPLVSPEGCNLGKTCEDDRIYLVCRPERFRGTTLYYCFSNYALNSNAPQPTLETNLDLLEKHVHWDAFDEAPYTAQIPEIEYRGVCKYFTNTASPASRMNRTPKRMAEFLVHSAVPLDYIECIIAKTDDMRDKLKIMMDASGWSIPIYTKPGCYFE